MKPSQLKHEMLYNERGQVTGVLETGASGKGTLVKRGVDPYRHQLRKPPGWAIDHAHLKKMVEVDAWGIVLLTTDGQMWTASVDIILKHSLRIDRGHGVQIVLPLTHWTVTDWRQGTLL